MFISISISTPISIFFFLSFWSPSSVFQVIEKFIRKAHRQRSDGVNMTYESSTFMYAIAVSIFAIGGMCGGFIGKACTMSQYTSYVLCPSSPPRSYVPVVLLCPISK